MNEMMTMMEVHPPEDPRVTIARDVLAQLDARRLVATHLSYLSLAGESRWAEWADFGLPRYEDREVRDVLVGKNCGVCALGALFVAKVDRHDAFRTSQMNSPHHSEAMRTYLAEFSQRQLLMIEAAFEGRKMYDELRYEFIDRETGDPEAAWIEDMERCFEWREGLLLRAAMRGTTDRGPEFIMRAIMQSIIDNGGEFRP